MQTQTIIAQYQKAITLLEMIERANNIIVDYHLKQVQGCMKIA